MIQVVNAEKGFGTQVLFKDVLFTLGRGERIGLVGRNGTGKTTLFKIILGDEHLDAGEIIVPKNYLIGTLRQHLHFTQPSILLERDLQRCHEYEGFHQIVGAQSARAGKNGRNRLCRRHVACLCQSLE